MLFHSGSPEYSDATRPHNASVDQRPALAAMPRSAEDIAEVISTAARTGRVIVPQASGHGAGAAVGDGEILLDTSALATVSIDPVSRTATVGSGATWGSVNGSAWRHGLLGLAGSSPSVSVSGYTFGGGVGWLGRRYGLASSSLREVVFVDGTGRLRTASEDAAEAEDREALWSFRGAGGVGLAVSLEFDLYPASGLHAGFLLWAADDLDPVVSAWSDQVASIGGDVASSIAVLRVPPAPDLPEALHGKTAVHLALASPDGDDADDLLAAVRSAAAPAVDTWGPADAERLAQIHLDPPDAVPAYGDARWLRSESVDHARDILTAASVDGSPIMMAEIRHVATETGARDGALTAPAEPFIYHAVGALDDRTRRADLDEAFADVRSAAGSSDTGRPVGTWMEGASAVPGSLPEPVRRRALRIAEVVDPEHRISRSRLLG